jgi:hypothetical protein
MAQMKRKQKKIDQIIIQSYYQHQKQKLTPLPSNTTTHPY